MVNFQQGFFIFLLLFVACVCAYGKAASEIHIDPKNSLVSNNVYMLLLLLHAHSSYTFFFFCCWCCCCILLPFRLFICRLICSLLLSHSYKNVCMCVCVYMIELNLLVFFSHHIVFFRSPSVPLNKRNKTKKNAHIIVVYRFKWNRFYGLLKNNEKKSRFFF